MVEEHEDATILFCHHAPHEKDTDAMKKFVTSLDSIDSRVIRAVFTGTNEQRRQKIDEYLKIREEEFAKKGRVMGDVYEIVVPANPAKPRGIMKA